MYPLRVTIKIILSYISATFQRQYMGCYGDSTGDVMLHGTSRTVMTPSLCADMCIGYSLTFFGLEVNT